MDERKAIKNSIKNKENIGVNKLIRIVTDNYDFDDHPIIYQIIDMIEEGELEVTDASIQGGSIVIEKVKRA